MSKIVWDEEVVQMITTIYRCGDHRVRKSVRETLELVLYVERHPLDGIGELYSKSLLKYRDEDAAGSTYSVHEFTMRTVALLWVSKDWKHRVLKGVYLRHDVPLVKARRSDSMG